MEIWKDIEGYESLYEVSNLGNVRRKPTIRRVTRKGELIGRKSKTLLPYICNSRYWRVMLSQNGKIKNILVHRLVAKAFIPNNENKPHVNHKDFDRSNNNVNNLEWCTTYENMKHANSKLLKGEAHPSSKLTNENVREIKQLKGKMSGVLLAKNYGVSHNAIQGIWYNRTWKHVI